MKELTVGIGGAAGDGLDKTGDTLAKTVSRLGLYVYAYNSYQSVIRGGHIWLRVRIGERKPYSHGDNLNVLIALNQDSIERHAREVGSGGAIIYNSEKLKLDPALVGDNVLTAPLPIGTLTKPFGKVQPIMQNTVALGTLMFLAGLEFETAAEVLGDTFAHKGQAVIDQNVAIARAGYDYASDNFVPLGCEWNFSRIRRPFLTGNEAFALGAVTAGCKFYSAYPMTPASSILHWMANHADQCGVVVKQCEDELADLNQVFGASQGDYPRAIIAPISTTDCFDTVVEAFNLAEKYQLPVTIISDLLVSEHPETIEPHALRPDVPIERGELVTEWPASKGEYKRYEFTPSGVSPRALPGTENTIYVSATDDHDEGGVLISDVFTSSAV